MRAFLTVSLLASPALLTGCGLVLDLQPGVDASVDARVESDARIPMDAARPDAQRPDAGDLRDGGCVARQETCNGLDDDCDDLVDEGIDLSSDPANCGACGRVCPAPPGTNAFCEGGTCAFECRDGRADCDGAVGNGCEVSLDDPDTCGSCSVACPSSAPLCAVSPGGALSCVPECTPPLISCGGACVDTAADPDHCGDCGRACFEDPSGIIECVEGACVVTDCGDWQADCNGDAADGCEQALFTNIHCGACFSSCPTGQVCDAGVCVATP